MKYWSRSGMFGAAVALLTLSGAAQAQSTDDDECSNATLQGDYGFTVHGQLLGLVTATGPQYFSAPVPIDAVAMTNFDGRGKLTQVGVNVVNGVVPPGPTDPETSFGINQSGRYTVFLDCTGSFELNLPGPISISASFVLANQGLEIHAVITKEHVASPILGCTSSTGCDVLPQYRSDGSKLQRGTGRGE